MFVLNLCPLTYANVTPSSSFGNATEVKVGSVMTQSGGRVDLLVARNSTSTTANIFTAVSEYKPGQGTYYRKSETRANLRNIHGVRSAGTVNATIEHQVSKRAVTDEIFKKAKIAGRALGKGAASLGRAAARRHPLGLAFALALEGLAGSDFFWDDEKGDFVRKKDDNTYIVFSSDNPASVRYEDYFLTYKKYHDACKSADCNFISFESGRENAKKAADNYCKSIPLKLDDETHHYEKMQLDVSSNCYAPQFNLISKKFVFIVPYYDTVPINNDEFFDESEPDADNNPNEWVETSGVEPTDEPKVEVPPGTVAQSDPYTDPKDGKTKQTRWDFDPNGRVRETVIPRPDLTPNSPEAPELKPQPEEMPTDKDGDKDKDKDKDSEKDKEKSETEDLCEKNPDIMACDKQPEKPDEQDFEIEHETVNVFFAPDTIFPTTGTCPAPISFRVDIPFAGAKTFEFDTAPACEIARRLRDLLIAIAWLVTAVFCFRSFSLKGS